MEGKCASVRYLSAGGRETRDQISGAPCVDTFYSFDPISLTESVSHEGRAWALIDTGADITHIDEALVPAHAIPLRKVMVSGATGSREAESYQIQIQIVGIETALLTEVVPLVQRERWPYRIVLGRSFLSRCRFVYDGPLGIRSITYLSADERASMVHQSTANRFL